ncbi:MAG: hypothetical protein GC202_08330 [Alphaproteobacteria bacterium]|nr:hypothetical protein [Alphaproteobacteria bacterium]
MSAAARTLTAAFFVLASILLGAPAWAGDNAVAGGRFTIWTPDQWVTKVKGDRLDTNNPPETVYVVATRLAGASASATARARAFIDSELDEVDFEGDSLNGTAQDGDDELEFFGTAVVDGADVLVLLVYVYDEMLKQPGPRQAVERIRASFKPQ